MILRSLLFVPADNDRKLAKARGVDADALILDLEDSVAPENRSRARGQAREFLAEKHPQSIWIRANHGSSDVSDLASAAPTGFVIPKVGEHDELYGYEFILDSAENQLGLAPNTIKLIPIVTETPEAVLNLDSYRRPPLARLAALTWGAEDLSAAIGASSNREADGDFTFPYKVVRALALVAARAAGLAAIETLHADFRDLKALERVARTARRDGFSGMLAIHPDQVPVINAAFTPTETEISHAQRIVAAFAAGEGVVSFEGRMLDRPHLKQAELVLEVARKKREGCSPPSSPTPPNGPP